MIRLPALLLSSAFLLMYINPGMSTMLPIRRVHAAQLSQEELYEYMARQEPLIITDAAPAPLRKEWNFQSFVQNCGGKSAIAGIDNHFLSIIDNMGNEERAMVNNRLYQLFNTSLADFRFLLTSKNITVRSLTRHMDGHRHHLDHGFEYFPDYALPLTLHDWPTMHCDSLVNSLSQHPIKHLLKYGVDWNSYKRIISSEKKLKKVIARTGHVFHAIEGSRAYPMHRHEQINENFMLLLDVCL